MDLAFEAAAAAELEAAATWYERERPGYGALFVEEVRRAVARAAKFPRSGVPVPGVGDERDARRFGLKRFPYVVVTAVARGERAVIAVAHTKRAPAYWRARNASK